MIFNIELPVPFIAIRPGFGTGSGSQSGTVPKREAKKHTDPADPELQTEENFAILDLKDVYHSVERRQQLQNFAELAGGEAAVVLLLLQHDY
jgi:hypothetical protein